MTDALGDFLTAYEEYLDGNREYGNVHAFPAARTAAALQLLNHPRTHADLWWCPPAPRRLRRPSLWRRAVDWFYWPPIPPARLVP